MNFQDKINILKQNEYFIKYTLNNEEIELIDLINEYREKNNIEKLMNNPNERIYDYFREQNLNNDKYLFIFQKGYFKNKLLEKDENIIKILSIDYLKSIMILVKKIMNIFLFIQIIIKKQLKKHKI